MPRVPNYNESEHFDPFTNYNVSVKSQCFEIFLENGWWGFGLTFVRRLFDQDFVDARKGFETVILVI